MMQNSDNIIVLDPLEQVAFGSEYINTLAFDPGNTTLLNGDVPQRKHGGAIGFFTLFGLMIKILSDLTYVWIDPRIDFESRQT